MGLLATRPIKRGELLISEKPVLFAPATTTVLFEKLMWGWNLEAHLEAQFAALEPAVQEQVMQLHDTEAAKSGSSKTMPGIFATNGLPQGVGSSDGVLCLTICRANHSCLSNCYHGWVAGEERLYADADIEENEEICTNYSQWYDCTLERQADLKLKFGFLCECRACSEQPERRAKHDCARELLGRLDEAIPQSAWTTPENGILMVEMICKLYEKELGIPVPHAVLCRLSYDAFQLSLSLEDVLGAQRWAKKAYEASAVTHGEKAEATQRLKRFMKDPMSRLRE